MLKTILLNIYIFSAILSFLLLVRMSCDVNRELNDKLDTNFGMSMLKIIIFTFIYNFHYILIPFFNTFMAIILLMAMALPQYEEVIKESMRRGIDKAKDERGLSDEEFDELIHQTKEKIIENEKEE